MTVNRERRTTEADASEAGLESEVRAHNAVLVLWATPRILAAGFMGLALPGAMSTDADGRLSFDADALTVAIEGLDRDGVDSALEKAEAARCDALDYVPHLLRRREDIRTSEFAAEIAAVDDPAILEGKLNDTRSRLRTFEKPSRNWTSGEDDTAQIHGLTRRIEACEARLAELVPTRSP